MSTAFTQVVSLTRGQKVRVASTIRHTPVPGGLVPPPVLLQKGEVGEVAAVEPDGARVYFEDKGLSYFLGSKEILPV
jgi:hypothetical protein